MSNLSGKLERIEARLKLYYKAEEAILTGQEYAMGSKRLRRADLADVQSMIRMLEKEAESLKQGCRNKVIRAVPFDI